jgi:Leucine-rich repeat (LRR) protein
MDNSLGLYLEKDGFYFDSIFNYKGALWHKEAICIFDNDIDKYVRYISKEKIDKVIIKRESNIQSLDFLCKIPHIKYLCIAGDIDYSPLYNLKHLKLLSISGSREIYVDKIEGLESFSTFYPGNVKGIDKAVSLKSLNLVEDYNLSKFINLDFLSNLINLDTLYLSNINLTTLEGIENLKNLKVLTLEDMNKLETIKHLTSLSSHLKSLRIESCNKIKDFDSIRELSELVFLCIDYVRLVPNLEFISKLKHLSTFISDSSNFIDGNLTPLTNIEHAYVYPIRKHYYFIKQNENKKAKEADFKYGERKMGDEEIELWRRIAY